MRDVYIIGHGGFGRELVAWASDTGSLNPIGFIDINPPNQNTVLDLPYLGDDSVLLNSTKPISALIGVGHPQIKRKIYEKLRNKVNFPNVIHPSVIIGTKVEIKPDSGVIITPGNIVTTNVKIGRQVMLNLSCSVGHDCIIEDFSTFSPGVNLSGNVIVGEGSYLGTGSSVIEGLTIGKWSIVGGQALVSKDVPDNSTCVGVPAKPIKYREEGWYK